ncbi:hypothetical protein JR316_0000385 [Psilocybe cubensis]|uniref:Uncharacterized protein n=2 Tax=Psilocybe cubensis TaxID=181762 RepID=A0A8H7Y9E4_PSICU|nr:hypothetical protein JR316_0000385 [Psilocybe cubensis]KAH9486321.1 hypothetical protein JR316_0000385 [Psilocybe cubensis]
MDTRSQGLLVNAAGFLYGTLGFALSVLAALLSAIYPSKVQYAGGIAFHKQPTLPNAARGRRPVRTISDQQVEGAKEKLPLLQVVEEVKKVSRDKTVRRSVSAHELRHSVSMVPVITVDYFGSAESPRRASAGPVLIDSPSISNPVTTLPEHIPFVITPPPTPPTVASSLPTSPPASAPCSPPATISSISTDASVKSDKSGFRLFHIKHWGKDKPKNTPNLARRQSSPHLCPKKLCHKHTNSDGNIPIVVNIETKPKSRKMLRKMSSGPVQEKVTTTPPPRKSEKKRSQTLRTHPYDAPYFAVPPVPPLPAYRPQFREEAIQQTRDPNASPGRSLEKKSSRSRLLKA